MPSRAFTLATVLGTDGNLNAQDVSGLAAVASTGSFSDVINKPTTTSGYGITDSSPTITSLVYAGNDLATDTTTPLAVTIIGTNFEASSNIYIDTISAANACTSLQYSGTTQITFTPPAKSAASYNVWLVGPSGKIAVLANGILYSGTPSWAGVATSYTTEANVVSIQLTAASTDTPVTYSLVSGTLPSGVTLSSTGLISGTAAITATTTYSNLVIRATDQQNQDANLTVSLTVTYIKPVTRSLRFNSADSAYLNRTPSVAGNRKTWTWSGWVKRSAISSSASYALFSTGTAVNDSSMGILMFANDDLRFTAATVLYLSTTQLFRDVSAWYHIVFAVDTTQATSSNRLKLYVNGSQVTALATANYPSQNTDLALNNNTLQTIGITNEVGTLNRKFDGYMAEVYFIDGQALTPSSFGETNPQTGVWRPISYTGSYGTNGFYLDFSDNSAATASTLGKDYSGNNNNWTPNNFSVASGAGNDSLVDSPTSYGTDTGVGGEVRGNYATLNPLANNGGTLANGNLDHTGTTAITTSTLFPTSGKWYCELTCTAYGGGASLGYTAVGVIQSSQSINTIPSSLGSVPVGLWIYRNDAYKANNGASASYGNTWTANDVIGVAIDIDAGKVWFAKNGTWQASGDPAAGTNAAYTNLSGSIGIAINDQGSYSSSYAANFGQRPFAYTAPSGFKALCTQNLPTPTIGATATTQAGDYFNTVLYSGAGTQAITGVGFQPDMVWLKSRSNVDGWAQCDAVRGADKLLQSNNTNAESTTASVSAFSSDGFTVDNNWSTSGRTYVSYSWKANGAGVTNTSGSITSTVSANQTSGFSIVAYNSGASGDKTVGHGLGVAPSMIITKSRTAVSSYNWAIYHASVATTVKKYLVFTTDALSDNGSNIWGSAFPTSSVFGITSGNGVNASTDCIAYCFAEVAGYSKFGSYTGNGSADGPFVYCGFRPAFILVKRSSLLGEGWWIYDNKRDTFNINDNILEASSSGAEISGGTYPIDMVSNGFKIRGINALLNTSTATYIYAAFAETPFKYSLAR